MPTPTAQFPTMIDLINEMTPEGGIMDVAEILELTNEMIPYMPFQEGNLPTGHQYNQRTGISDITWRSWYQGVQPTWGTTVKVTDSAGMMRAYSIVDKELADLNGNSMRFRANEDRAKIQSFNNSFGSSLFYGDEKVNPERFTGLSPRYNSINTSKAASAANVLDAGGTASTNSSIWLLVLGPGTMFPFYPKGSQAGLRVEDQGKFTIQNAPTPAGGIANGFMEAYKTYYGWDVGFAVPDWRYGVRIANVDQTLLTKDAASGADIIDLMTQALEKVQDLNSGEPIFCCTRTVRSFLRRQEVAKVKSSTLTMEEVGGRKVLTFDGVPICRCDSLLGTEAQVTN